MGKRYFYSSTTDPNLPKEIWRGCGLIYIQKHEYQGNAVLTLNGGGDDYLVLADSGAANDGDYDSSVADNLYIIDDNSALARGKVKSCRAESDGTVLRFEADDMVLESDGATAPTLTDGTTYTVLVLSGSNYNLFGDYFGYMDDSCEWDPSIETDPLEVCTEEGTMEEIAEAVSKRMNNVTGATFNVPNSDVISKMLNMEQYGLNSGTRKEYHGGFSPDISAYYQMTLKTIDWQNYNMAFQMFKGQLFNNGAIPFTGGGWKKISWQFKGKKDTMRSNSLYNAFRFIYGF